MSIEQIGDALIIFKIISTEQDKLTDLRGGETLLAKFKDLFFNIISGQFQPRRDTATVRQCRLGNTLTETENTLVIQAMW